MALTKATFSVINGACANVLDYGADRTGSADSHGAFVAAVASGAQKIYVPAGTYSLSDGVALGYGQGIVGDGYREETQLIFNDTLATTTYGISLGDGGYAEKLRLSRQTSVKTDTGISLNVTASTSKWCRIRDIYLDDWENGIWTSSYYHTIDSCILAGNKYGIKIGGSASFYAGATTLTGCYFRDNTEAGLYVSALSNTNACYNCVWEVNQVHIVCNGAVAVHGGYLADPPITPIQGTGRIYVNLGDVDTVYGGSDGTAYGKNVTTTDYAYGVRISNATLENLTMGINEQSRSTPSPGTVLRGSILGEGRYTLNNVKFSTQAQTDALNVLENSSTITQQILSNGIPIKNYVNNGLFLDRVKAADPLYITANGGMKAGANNPWGGGVLLMSRFGSRIRWTVPENNVGKQHYLMIYKGVFEGTGSTSSGPGIDTASSTNLTFDVSTPNIVQIGSQYSPNIYALVGGADQSGRITIGLSVVLVTPTATTGEIKLSYNASDATTYMQIFGIVMTERNDVGDTEAEGWPIGWFDTPDAVLL